MARLSYAQRPGVVVPRWFCLPDFGPCHGGKVKSSEGKRARSVNWEPLLDSQMFRQGANIK